MDHRQQTETSPAQWAAPMAVGVLLLLYAFATWLMSEGEANPAFVLLAVTLGVGALAWGYYAKARRG